MHIVFMFKLLSTIKFTIRESIERDKIFFIVFELFQKGARNMKSMLDI